MNTRSKISNIVNVIIIVGYVCIVGLLLVINIVFQGKEYLFKKDFILPNIGFLGVAVALVMVGYFLYRYLNISVNKYVILVLSGILFVLQCFLFYNILFVTQTWDAWRVICDAKNMAADRMVNVDVDYYSHFPNNICILAIFTGIIKVANFIGVMGIEQQLYIIVVIQSIIATITGLLLFKIVKKGTKKDGCALIAWLIYVLLLGVSAQVVIPYSDMMSLLFPTLLYYVYQSLDNERFIYVKWFFIALLSYIGYVIKPTAIIIFIAIVICEVLHEIIYVRKDNIIKGFKIVGIIVASLIIAFVISRGALKSIEFPLNAELKNGPLHMFLMGTNNETNGSFSPWDVQSADSIPNKSERQEMQIERIKERVLGRGFSGNIKFYVKKALMIFNDGTFAVGDEGGYYDLIFSDKTCFSPALKSWYYAMGEKFRVSSSIQQGLWILVLLLNALSVFVKKDRKNVAIVLSLIGIIIFNMLFEARARYLLIYVPLFIVMAMNALSGLYEYIAKKTGGAKE